MIDIREHAEKARASGVPAAVRVHTADGEPVDFEVSADGSVRPLTAGWVIEAADGQITAMYPMPADPVSEVQQGFVGLHVLFTSLRQGGFTIDEAAAVVAAMVRGGAASQEEA